MDQIATILSKPILVADYKAAIKELTQLPCFTENNYRIKIPMGWIFIIRDLVRDLTAAAKGNQEMADFQIYRLAQLNTGDLFAELSHSNNRAVKGLVRKAIERGRHTCQCCGITGRRYRIGEIHRSWCPDCAAPLLILADIRTLDELLLKSFGSPTFPVRHMPTGLRHGFRKWVALHESRMPEPSDEVGTWYAREWRSALRPMESALNKLLDSGRLRGDAK